MKKHLLTLCLAATAGWAMSQITLVDETNGNVITPGSTFMVSGTTAQADLNYDLIKAVNNTGTTTKINMRRYELTAPAGTKNYFCWYVCLTEVNAGASPTLNHSAGPVMNSNNGDTLDLFSGHHKPYGVPGMATFRYVWFDINDPNDSTYIDISFDIALGVEENKISHEINLYPNPANAFVKYDYSLTNTTGSDKHLVIMDVLGNKVREIAINNEKGVITVDIHSLKAGIYFYSLLVDGKAIETKRLMIQH
ncbi:MAG: T9SS type A sorting domain-containing protein [Bacteroidota bacterium]